MEGQEFKNRMFEILHKIEGMDVAGLENEMKRIAASVEEITKELNNINEKLIESKSNVDVEYGVQLNKVHGPRNVIKSKKLKLEFSYWSGIVLKIFIALVIIALFTYILMFS